jgi:hypothetical protein
MATEVAILIITSNMCIMVKERLVGELLIIFVQLRNYFKVVR